MSDADNKNIFSAADILKYQQGLLSPQERHALEKAALEDPFLADALEGFAITGAPATEMQNLQQRLQSRISKEKVIPMGSGKPGFPWLRIAAIFIVLAGAGIPAYIFIFRSDKKEIAQQEIKQVPAPVTNNKVATDTLKVQPSADRKVSTIPQTDARAEAGKTSNPQQPRTDALEEIVVAPPDEAKRRLDSLQQFIGSNSEKTQRKDLDYKKSSDKEFREIAGNTNPALKFEKNGQKQNNKGFTIQGVTEPGNNRSAAPGVVLNQNGSGQDDQLKSRNATVYNYNNFRGRVTDNNNNPLPFANITNLEDNVGTYSDAKGYFNLTSPDSILNVQVKSVGFNLSNLTLRKNLPSNQVTLDEDRSVNALVLNTNKPNADLHARNNNQKLTEPEPSDGWDNYDTYLTNNLNIPNDYKNLKSVTGGEVEVSFEVDKNGEPTNIKVEKSLCNTCDQEAIRLIKQGPKWKRNTKNGRTTVKISF